MAGIDERVAARSEPRICVPLQSSAHSAADGRRERAVSILIASNKWDARARALAGLPRAFSRCKAGASKRENHSLRLRCWVQLQRG
jgi:hypothetical protein